MLLKIFLAKELLKNFTFLCPLTRHTIQSVSEEILEKCEKSITQRQILYL
jgi:hypothetical protein